MSLGNYVPFRSNYYVQLDSQYRNLENNPVSTDFEVSFIPVVQGPNTGVAGTSNDFVQGQPLDPTQYYSKGRIDPDWVSNLQFVNMTVQGIDKDSNSNLYLTGIMSQQASIIFGNQVIFSLGKNPFNTATSNLGYIGYTQPYAIFMGFLIKLSPQSNGYAFEWVQILDSISNVSSIVYEVNLKIDNNIDRATSSQNLDRIYVQWVYKGYDFYLFRVYKDANNPYSNYNLINNIESNCYTIRAFTFISAFVNDGTEVQSAGSSYGFTYNYGKFSSKGKFLTQTNVSGIFSPTSLVCKSSINTDVATNQYVTTQLNQMTYPICINYTGYENKSPDQASIDILKYQSGEVYLFTTQNNEAKLNIQNVSNPYNFGFLTSFNTGDIALIVRVVKIVNDIYAVVVCNASNMKILNVTDVYNVFQVGSDISISSTPYDLLIENIGVGYYCILSTNGQIEIYNITNPAIPITLSPIINLPNASNMAFTTSNNYLYVLLQSSNPNIHIINLTNPSAPVSVTEFLCEIDSKGIQIGVCSGRTILFVGTTRSVGYIQVYDVTSLPVSMIDTVFGSLSSLKSVYNFNIVEQQGRVYLDASTFGDRIFHFVNGSTLYYSSDGTNWTECKGVGGVCTSLICSDLIWVCSTNNFLYYSIDGIKWYDTILAPNVNVKILNQVVSVMPAPFTPVSKGNPNYLFLACGESNSVAGGYSILWSDDGVYWKYVFYQQQNLACKGIAYGRDNLGNLYSVVVGVDGVGAGAILRSFTSKDEQVNGVGEKTYTLQYWYIPTSTLNYTSTALKSVVFDPIGKTFVCGGSGTHRLLYSSDYGQTWIPSGGVIPSNVNSVRCNVVNGISTLVAVGNSVVYSTDSGVTWNTGLGTLLTTGNTLACTYYSSSPVPLSGPLWLASGVGATTTISSEDGITWTSYDQGGNTGNIISIAGNDTVRTWDITDINDIQLMSDSISESTRNITSVYTLNYNPLAMTSYQIGNKYYFFIINQSQSEVINYEVYRNITLSCGYLFTNPIDISSDNYYFSDVNNLTYSARITVGINPISGRIFNDYVYTYVVVLNTSPSSSFRIYQYNTSSSINLVCENVSTVPYPTDVQVGAYKNTSYVIVCSKSSLNLPLDGITFNSQLQIFDLSNIYVPKLLSTITVDLGQSTYLRLSQPFINPTTLSLHIGVISENEDKLYIYDISNPTTPTLVSTTTTISSPTWIWYGEITGPTRQFLYIGSSGTSIGIYEVTNPSVIVVSTFSGFVGNSFVVGYTNVTISSTGPPPTTTTTHNMYVVDQKNFYDKQLDYSTSPITIISSPTTKGIDSGVSTINTFLTTRYNGLQIPDVYSMIITALYTTDKKVKSINTYSYDILDILTNDPLTTPISDEPIIIIPNVIYDAETEKDISMILISSGNGNIDIAEQDTNDLRNYNITGNYDGSEDPTTIYNQFIKISNEKKNLIGFNTSCLLSLDPSGLFRYFIYFGGTTGAAYPSRDVSAIDSFISSDNTNMWVYGNYRYNINAYDNYGVTGPSISFVSELETVNDLTVSYYDCFLIKIRISDGTILKGMPIKGNTNQIAVSIDNNSTNNFIISINNDGPLTQIYSPVVANYPPLTPSQIVYNSAKLSNVVQNGICAYFDIEGNYLRSFIINPDPYSYVVLTSSIILKDGLWVSGYTNGATGPATVYMKNTDGTSTQNIYYEISHSQQIDNPFLLQYSSSGTGTYLSSNKIEFPYYTIIIDPIDERLYIPSCIGSADITESTILYNNNYTQYFDLKTGSTGSFFTYNKDGTVSATGAYPFSTTIASIGSTSVYFTTFNDNVSVPQYSGYTNAIVTNTINNSFGTVYQTDSSYTQPITNYKLSRVFMNNFTGLTGTTGFYGYTGTTGGYTGYTGVTGIDYYGYYMFIAGATGDTILDRNFIINSVTGTTGSSPIVTLNQYIDISKLDRRLSIYQPTDPSPPPNYELLYTCSISTTPLYTIINYSISETGPSGCYIQVNGSYPSIKNSFEGKYITFSQCTGPTGATGATGGICPPGFTGPNNVVVPILGVTGSNVLIVDTCDVFQNYTFPYFYISAKNNSAYYYFPFNPTSPLQDNYYQVKLLNLIIPNRTILNTLSTIDLYPYFYLALYFTDSNNNVPDEIINNFFTNNPFVGSQYSQNLQTILYQIPVSLLNVTNNYVILSETMIQNVQIPSTSDRIRIRLLNPSCNTIIFSDVITKETDSIYTGTIPNSLLNLQCTLEFSKINTSVF